MKIGALAQKTGLSIQTIRFYERRGLLPRPERTQSNYRIYCASALKQLLFIKQCRSLDMSIAEIDQLLVTKAKPENSCSSVNETIERHIEDVNNRIDELTALQHSLLSIKSACADNVKVKDCGVLNELENVANSED
ncbi:MAG: Cd(II)/Pb(II)-responsive transcriptional regulator [Aliiglaciecola sp.]|uniref:Cd(II)/Pb(II)-responsive transcriptional regulator n=1 Tax=Aliiglaciecola sp. M165 TaxID=2593649 RepID=UPI00118080B8|nr:Cd(II)/Pb(II)-responsive transcriptional regulator [Aliiglaciecola sp. M165]TRY32506.1 Cd(II)/Pb(II)-responsive transcriptional regulator [Aliiglaciecola sp. M165]